MRFWLRLTMAVCLALITLPAQAGERVHWGYEGPGAPAHWGDLSPGFAICKSGKNQSPIDLAGFIKADLKPLEIMYQPGGKAVLNNGHTIQIEYAPGSRLMLDGREFKLVQYHFHAPSENTIEGRSYPMEVHLVHADKDGNLAVIGVMFTEGPANKSLEGAWARMPAKAGGKAALDPPASAGGLLPAGRDYYRFNGSLTTPPCSEGVIWLMMKEAVGASREQIDAFTKVMGHPTNRPVQPVNARVILE